MELLATLLVGFAMYVLFAVTLFVGECVEFVILNIMDERK